jgi:hypothetical protein
MPPDVIDAVDKWASFINVSMVEMISTMAISLNEFLSRIILRLVEM